MSRPSLRAPLGCSPKARRIRPAPARASEPGRSRADPVSPRGLAAARRPPRPGAPACSWGRPRSCARRHGDRLRHGGDGNGRRRRASLSGQGASGDEPLAATAETTWLTASDRRDPHDGGEALAHHVRPWHPTSKMFLIEAIRFRTAAAVTCMKEVRRRDAGHVRRTPNEVIAVRPPRRASAFLQQCHAKARETRQQPALRRTFPGHRGNEPTIASASAPGPIRASGAGRRLGQRHAQRLRTGHRRARDDRSAGAVGDAPTAAVATVLLIDGRPLMRECLTRGMRRSGPRRGSRPRAGTSSRPWPRREHVDLCLVSLGTGGTLERVRAAFPQAALVVLSDDDAYADGRRGRRAGRTRLLLHRGRPRACWCRASGWC